MKTQSILGHVSSAVHEGAFGVSYLALRAVTGLLFFMSGWNKVTTDWTAASYLSSANGPFADWFHSLAGSGVVDAMNAWGMLLLGVALLLGLCTRPAAIGGMILMVLYYFAHLSQNIVNGYVDEHVILFVVLALFAAGGVGHAFGLNSVILGNIRKPKAWMRWILG